MTSSALACFNAACSHILRAPKHYLHFTIGCGKQELYHRVLFKKSQFCELLCCTCTKMSRHIEFARQSRWGSGHARVACFPKLLHEFLKLEVTQRKTCSVGNVGGFNGMFGAGQNSRSWQACNNGFRTHLALLLVVHAVGSVTLLQLLTNVACGVEL